VILSILKHESKNYSGTDNKSYMSMKTPFKRMIIIITVLAAIIAMVFTGAIIWINTTSARCFAADSVVFLDTTNAQGRKRILVLRTVGFTDKVSFLEVYTDSAVFDVCGQPRTEPEISRMACCTDTTMLPMAAKYGKDSLELCCTSDTTKGVWWDSLKFTDSSCAKRFPGKNDDARRTK
jgi:hypothetical protein